MNEALTILIIRHGEKSDAADDPGLSDHGNVDNRSLTLRGWQRAGAWAALFGASLGGADYPAPGAIYAADPERAVVGQPKRRQLQTVAPLAARLGLEPVTRFAKGEEEGLARDVLGLRGVVLISWAHELIAGALLPALGANHSPGAPRGWDSARYDVVLRLDRDRPGAPFSVRQLFPRLLAGDSDRPLP